MVFGTILRRARRGISPVSQRVRRFAGGGPEIHPEYFGFEKKLREVFPMQWQLVLFYMGCWTGLYMVYKAIPKSPPKPVIEEAPVATGNDDIPSISSPEFETWSKIKGNMKKWEDSLEPWAAALK